MWTLTGPTLTNKAGLWKSDDKWNLIPFKPEIFNSTDDKGELDFFLIVKEGFLYNPVSQTLSGPPYGNGNDWFYYNDSAWVNPIDEIIIECSLTTLGKLRLCCI